MREVPQLGERGGGWVALQFAVIGAVLVALVFGTGWPEDVSRPLAVVGVVLAAGGVVVAALSARALGGGLTPFPRPAGRGRLVVRGPYRVVRHPIYASGILFLAGLSLAFSPAALVLTIVLAVVWTLKITVEERFLLATYPEYEAYCARTRYRLIPFVH